MASIAETMTRLSSRQTFWMKRVLPILWAAILVVVVYQAVANWLTAGVSLLWLAPPLLAGFIALSIIRKRVTDLVDEVWDDGESLSVRNGETEMRIALHSIVEVRYSNLASPQRVTLRLREASAFGREIAFMPPITWLPWRRHPRIESLIQRVAAPRSKV